MNIEHYENFQKVLDEMSQEDFFDLIERSSQNINMNENYQLVLDEISQEDFLNLVEKSSQDYRCVLEDSVFGDSYKKIGFNSFNVAGIMEAA